MNDVAANPKREVNHALLKEISQAFNSRDVDRIMALEKRFVSWSPRAGA